MHPCRSLSLVLILATCGVTGAEAEVVRARAVEAPTVIAPEAFDPTLAATAMEQLFARLAVVQPESTSVIDLGPLSAVEDAVLRGDGATESRRLLVGVDRQVPIITLELPRKPLREKSFLAENLEGLRAALRLAKGVPRDVANAPWH